MQFDAQHFGSVADWLSAGAAFFAALAALMSWKVTSRAYADQKADEELILGQLQHPELRQWEHSWSVLATQVVNRSGRKAVIRGVRLLTRGGDEVPIRWSGEIDECGYPLGASGVLGVVDSATVYLRRCDGDPIRDGIVEIRHSFAALPLQLSYTMSPGWDSFIAGGPGPRQDD